MFFKDMTNVVQPELEQVVILLHTTSQGLCIHGILIQWIPLYQNPLKESE